MSTKQFSNCSYWFVLYCKTDLSCQKKDVSKNRRIEFSSVVAFWIIGMQQSSRRTWIIGWRKILTKVNDCHGLRESNLSGHLDVHQGNTLRQGIVESLSSFFPIGFISPIENRNQVRILQSKTSLNSFDNNCDPLWLNSKREIADSHSWSVVTQ